MTKGLGTVYETGHDRTKDQVNGQSGTKEVGQK